MEKYKSFITGTTFHLPKKKNHQNWKPVQFTKRKLFRKPFQGGSVVVIDFGKIMRSFREVPGHPVF